MRQLTTPSAMEQFLDDTFIPLLQHPLYSTDLPPCDFCLFPKLKNALKGTHFQSVDDVRSKTAEILNKVSADDPQHCSEQWKIQWCIDRTGKYVERNSYYVVRFKKKTRISHQTPYFIATPHTISHFLNLARFCSEDRNVGPHLPNFTVS
jgi:hypothetical protein